MFPFNLGSFLAFPILQGSFIFYRRSLDRARQTHRRDTHGDGDRKV